jgi:hypothetical protein
MVMMMMMMHYKNNTFSLSLSLSFLIENQKLKIFLKLNCSVVIIEKV